MGICEGEGLLQGLRPERQLDPNITFLQSEDKV